MKKILSLAFVASIGMSALSIQSHAALIVYGDAGAFSAATTAVLIEDFESVTVAYDTPHASYTSHGLTYTGYAGVSGSNVFFASPGYTNFGIAPALTTSSILTANGDEDFTIDLSPSSTAIGFNTYLNDFGPGVIAVYLNGVFAASYNIAHDPTTVGYFGVVSTSGPISQIRWTTSGGAQVNTGIDNISVQDDRRLPTPAPLLLVGAGLLGLWQVKRVA